LGGGETKNFSEISTGQKENGGLGGLKVFLNREGGGFFLI
jgi:hypothetical protein